MVMVIHGIGITRKYMAIIIALVANIYRILYTGLNASDYMR